MKYLVTGGGGYFGSKLGLSLASDGADVCLFDLNISFACEDSDKTSKQSGALTSMKGDVSVLDDVLQACKDVDCIMHVASFGMSGRDMLNTSQIEAVNIQGTKNIIEACRKCGVTSLVYTSTTNVVFCGEPITNGDETLPYVPDEKHVDHYSRTKCIAEQAVLQANGYKVAGGKTLHTCAIRPAGIYGEGEQRHLPRIVNYIERGLFKFTYGSNNLVEFVHVDNLVQSHKLAALNLASTNPTAAGQPYFISDGQPVNNFEFFRPLVEGLGYTYPRMTLPVNIIYFFAFFIELIHGIIGRYIYNFQPFLTRAEVFKTGVTHYFKIDKAKKDLGYEPKSHDMLGVVRFFRQQGHGRSFHHKKYTTSNLLRDLALAAIVVIMLFSLLPVVTT
ncbi:short-chain dehydrogenase/reductase family 42E member 1-like [Corticium candelabrum]|uniref:short-chain dehydrogenase/reductase family 42E member 1-like n=1 Tax=Corticium candelabrum TaxID=121492 RepID=UPI002E31B982|nr:short-chain dehydrogenase/reductase family 42E member 1-like [Corticium candelabrum]